HYLLAARVAQCFALPRSRFARACIRSRPCFRSHKMRVSKIVVTVFIAFAGVCIVTPARAQENSNFVKKFLDRYRSPNLAFPSAPDAASTQAIVDQTRAGQLPLTMGEYVNRILQNNLNIGVDRLTPLSSRYSVMTNYRPFEPTVHFKATVNRNTTPGTSFLA